MCAEHRRGVASVFAATPHERVPVLSPSGAGGREGGRKEGEGCRSKLIELAAVGSVRREGLHSSLTTRRVVDHFNLDRSRTRLPYMA